MNRLTHCLACMALIGAFAHTANAQHVDILAYNNSGRVSTGFIDVDSGLPQLNERLYTETFDTILPGLFGTTAPGYFNNETYPLLPSSDLSFDALAITNPDAQVTANLLYWDGDGSVGFAAPTDGTTLQFRLSSSINVSVDGSSGDVPGFIIEGTGPTGVLHKHISYSARNSSADPADGLYLASISLRMPGLADSDPVYLLFNAHYQRDAQDNILFNGDTPLVDPDSQTLASAWIEQNLIASPLPGDLNGDGFVGLDDLDIVLQNWNLSVPPADPTADPSGDGFVGLDDLDTVLNNWNAGTPPRNQSVPEPGSAALVLFAGGVMAMVRRSAP